jgi:glucosamine 6-phosphate synthetase-like amidotransferase/phosphosugar isomerase protein
MKHIFLLPEQIESILARKEEIRTIAQDFSVYQNMFFVGRRYQLPIAYE